ncbi:MAG TPA: M14 family zinc carboxypeptidase [Rubricoccaceae bacterium]|nr:M14 family zinc carboxypeptidase [Rubricoccaceae bacterium]
MLRRCLFALLAFVTLAGPAVFAQQVQERYSEVRLYFPADGDLAGRLAARGLILDHGTVEGAPGGRALRTVLSATELSAAQAAGVAIDVLLEDVAAEVAARNARYGGCPTTPYPITGSMGCYPTYDEVLALLDAMRAQFPNLISARTSIGSSHEGRSLWMVEITDNPGMDEGEPEVLYTAIHHAREPQGLATVLHYMWDLLEKYGTDPEATYLLQNRRLFFVPILNPDGYVYNQTTNPGGGGMWRKNRRNNGSSFGVDLNRNYGYQWGYDNSGSSPSPTSETYRGPSAFSEPETQAIRDFVNARDFRLAFNYHTFSDLLLYPWGYVPTPPPDDPTFARYAAPMTAVNGYTYGPGNTTIYPTNGGSDDWMYGDTAAHAPILSYTPEVGSTGFWPSPEEILPLAEENLRANYLLAWFAGGYPEVGGTDYVEAEGPSGNGYVDPGDRFEVRVRLVNIGQEPLTSVGAIVESVDPRISLWSGPMPVYFTIAPGDTAEFTGFQFRTAETAPLGNLNGLVVKISADGGATQLLTAPLPPVRLGTPTEVFADAAASMANWTTSGGWGLSTTAYSPPSAFADSPSGNYPANANARLTLRVPLDLSAAAAATLRFRTRWDIEPAWDFGQVLYSTNGSTFTPLAGRYTTPGAGQGQQPAGEPGYDGTQTAWVAEEMDLAPAVGAASVTLLFRLRADGAVQEDGWYVDDIVVETLADGSPVGTPPVPEAFTLALDPPTPNPFRGAAQIAFTLPAGGAVELAVYDVLGRRVAVLADGPHAAGRHVATVEAGAFPAGVYVARLTTGGQTVSRPLTVAR